jgi:multidrug efflux pump subunit AcrA (membrane-fusion protein)
MRIPKGNTTWVIVACVGAVLGLAVIAGALGVNFNGRGEGQSASAPGVGTDGKTEQATVVVTVAPVTLQPIQRKIQIVGTFCSMEEVTVSPKVEGRVKAIHFDKGDVVTPGQVLMEIDPTDYKLAVEEKTREVASELAKLNLTELPAADFNVKEHIEQLPSVARAKLLTDNMARRYKRAEELFKKRTVSEEEWQQIQTDREVAEATLQQAKLEAMSSLAMAYYKNSLLATAEQRLRDTKILVPEPTLETVQVLLQRSQVLKKSDTIEYVVAQRMAAEGEIVRPGGTQSLFKLVMNRPLKFVGSVPERFMRQLRDPQTGSKNVTQKVEIRVDSNRYEIDEPDSADDAIIGEILRVSPTVDPVSRTYQIEAIVPNPRRLLKVGGFAKAGIIIREDDRAVTVPIEAVLTYVGSSRIFVARDGKAHQVQVKLGESGRGWM